MQHVKDILAHKGNSVFSVTPESSVYESLKKMSEKGIGSVLVMDGDVLSGILTERDYARKVALLDKNSRNIPVKDIMTTKVLCVTPERSVDECMALMSGERARHLPVLENDKVIGVISIGDLVKAVIHDQKILIDQLQQYITG